MSYKLLSAILKSPWFIDPGYVENHMLIIADLLERKGVSAGVSRDKDLEETIRPYIFEGGRIVEVQGSLRNGVDYNSVPKGSIAVIPVKGPLMKEDEEDCGYFTAGTATLGKRIQEADNHPNIKGMIVIFDTPGGTVDGIQAFADTIKATEKPIVGFVDGFCASAGVYAISSCDYIVAQDITAEMGSIGVMMYYADTQPYYEKLGVKFHEVVSTLSPDKNLNWKELRQGKYENFQKEGLDPFAKIFHAQVQNNRPGVKAETMTGKMYMAEEALTRGLCDEIGGIQVAVNKVEELANAKATASINKPKKEMKQFAKLNALLGIELMESTDEGTYLNEDQLQMIEDAIAAKEAAEAELATAKEDLTAAQADLETEKAKVIERDTTIAGIKKLPAANTAKVVKATDKNEESETSDDLINACETGTMAGLDALKKQGLI
jgi:protease-4